MNAKSIEDSPRHKSKTFSADLPLLPSPGHCSDETFRLPELCFDDCGSLLGDREEQFALEEFLYSRNRF
jgi:hypothetical protein